MEISRIALITAIIGTVILAFLSLKLEPKQLEIGLIENSDLGEYVKITGQAINVKTSKITQFDLKDPTGEIRVVSFSRINITRGENLEVIGKVDEYHGFLEIVAEKIMKG